jgi:peptidoglycan hydrolase CwlO-like protein
MGEGSEGDEGQRLLEIIDEQKARIAELERDSVIHKQNIKDLQGVITDRKRLYEEEVDSESSLRDELEKRDAKVAELQEELEALKAGLEESEQT